MLPLLPIVVCCLGAAAYHKASRRGPGKGVLTKERQHFYEVAIKEVSDPEKLRAFAKVFRDEGLSMHAEMLEKRAELRAMPDAKRHERRKIFKRAMKSTNATAIRTLANAFEKEGCTGAAKDLRDYAASLPISPPGEVTPIVPASPSPPAPPSSETVEVIQTEAVEDDTVNPDSLTEEEDIPSSDETEEV